MARKAKPNFNMFEQPVEINTESIANTKIAKCNDLSDVQNALILDTITNSIVGDRITPEQKEKLELFDSMKDENLSLLKKNEELEEKISEYISELNTLRSDISSVNEFKEKNKALSTELEELKNKYDSININELKKLNAELQEASDSYLMRISELSFENAKMVSEIQELTLKINSSENGINSTAFSPQLNVPTKQQIPTASPYVNPYNPYTNNGYGVWN